MHGKRLKSRHRHTYNCWKSYFSSACRTVTTEEIAAFILGPNLRGLKDSSQDMFQSHLRPFALQQTLERSNLGSYTFPKQTSTSVHLKSTYFRIHVGSIAEDYGSSIRESEESPRRSHPGSTAQPEHSSERTGTS